MMHRLVEVIFPAPAPTDHIAMTEDLREEEEDLDVAEVVLLTAVAMMLVVTRHMIKRHLKESRMAHTTLVLVKIIIRPCPMELPLSTRPEITTQVTMKVRLTTEFEHFETTSHERANISFLCLSCSLGFHASSALRHSEKAVLSCPRARPRHGCFHRLLDIDKD